MIESIPECQPRRRVRIALYSHDTLGLLEIGLKELLKLRRHTIRVALKAFQPDVFVIDNVPRGAGHELDRVLEKLR
jgi:predicted glycosyltransferase